MQLIKLFYKDRLALLAIALIAGLAAFLLAYSKPASYEASIDLIIHYEGMSPSASPYDSMRAAGILGENIESWFKSPSFLRRVYERSGIDPALTAGSMAGNFKVKQIASQNILIRFSDLDKERTEKIALAVQSTVGEEALNLNKMSDGSNVFRVTGDIPVISESRPPLGRSAACGALSGLFLGMALVCLKAYRRY